MISAFIPSFQARKFFFYFGFFGFSAFFERNSEQAHEKIKYQNLMFEKRVYRGNTHAAQIIRTDNEGSVASSLPVSAGITASTGAQRKLAKKKTDNMGSSAEAQLPGDSAHRAVAGREHAETWTAPDVESITSKAPCLEQETQTEFELQKKQVRLVLPVKTGTDKETQIYDGDLFDFNYEVEPLLEVLCGRTLDQSRVEVLEEEELRTMREKQTELDQIKARELEEVRAIESREKKLMEENEKRKKEFRGIKIKAIESHKLVVSRILAKEYTRKLQTQGLERLNELGFFKDKSRIELDERMLEFFAEAIGQSCLTFDEIVKGLAGYVEISERNLLETHGEYVAEHKKRVEIKRQEEENLRLALQEEKKREAEARAKRREERRKQRLREKVMEQFVSKGEQKEDFYQVLISDVDSLGVGDVPSVGTVGGVWLELLELFSIISEMQKSGQEKYEAAKKIPLTSSSFGAIMEKFLNECFDTGKIDLGISEETMKKLSEIDQEVKLENLFMMDGSGKPEAVKVLRQGLISSGFNLLKEELEGFEELATVLSSRLAHMIINDDTICSKFRISVVNESVLSKASVFVKMKPLFEDPNASRKISDFP